MTREVSRDFLPSRNSPRTRAEWAPGGTRSILSRLYPDCSENDPGRRSAMVVPRRDVRSSKSPALPECWDAPVAIDEAGRELGPRRGVNSDQDWKDLDRRAASAEGSPDGVATDIRVGEAERPPPPVSLSSRISGAISPMYGARKGSRRSVTRIQGSWTGFPRRPLAQPRYSLAFPRPRPS